MSNLLHVSDLGLKAQSGHHVGALRALAQARGKQEVVFYGNQNPAPELLAEAKRNGVSITPFFSTYYYDAIHAKHTIVELNSYINSLAREYIRLFEVVAQSSPAGRILHHTMDWPHLQALGIAIAQSQQSFVGGLEHVVSLIHNPGVSIHGRVTDQRRFLCHRMALRRLHRYQNVRLFASDRETANGLALALPEAMKIPVHPSFFFVSSRRPNNARAPESGYLSDCLRKGTITLYAGHVREEKGFGDLPELIRIIRPYLESEGRLQIQVDINDNLSPLDGHLLRVLEELRTLATLDRRIKLIDAFLPHHDLDRFIAESDLVFFNYNSRAYASRSSGLLWQACCVQVPVVVIGDSWLSREARRLNSQSFAFSTLGGLEKSLSESLAITPDQTELDADYRETLFGSVDEFLIRLSSERYQGGPTVPWISARSRQPGKKPRVFVVDADVPDPDASGGGYAAVQEMRLLQALGYSVSFSTTTGCFLNDQAARLIDEGIEVLWCPRYQDATQALVERGHEFDLVYATRYHVAKVLIENVRFFAPQATLVLHVADLHFLREMRKASLSQEESAMEFAERLCEDEMTTLSRVDLVLTYTDVEQAMIQPYLRSEGRVAICPWVEEIHTEAPPYEGRRDIAFLGGYAHAPNVDAVAWFVEDVMPILRGVLPGVCFRVYGANVPTLLESYETDDVFIDGFAENLSEVFDSCRVFVAPLRYGAGLKAKVAAALARGVPCVVSPVAAEGFSPESNPGLAVAHTPEEWVAAISALYSDSEAWAAASRGALDYASMHFSFDDGVRRMAEALGVLDETRAR